MTALSAIIADMIAADGPMPLDRYMALCLGHPQHGYYIKRDPLGARGDFTTAPEISQVFGELVGVWLATAWQAIGSPSAVALVELGPGRGTLMADILRVFKKLPALEAVPVHFVETSPALRDQQRERVPHATWHSSIASLPSLPLLLVANEFFDALPIRQFERENGQVFERVVGLRDGALAVGRVPSPQRLAFKGQGVFEDAGIRNAIAVELGDKLMASSGAGLVIDYGHERSAAGDTLQAMRAHAFCAVTDHPGEADITSHVDFEQLARAFTSGGASIAGFMTQGEFLEQMGIEQRTRKLAATLQGNAQAEFISASNRLAQADQMGHLFKVMAVTGHAHTKLFPFGET